MRRKAKELDRKSGGKPKLDHLLDLAENFQSTLHNLAIEVILYTDCTLHYLYPLALGLPIFYLTL